MRTQALAGRLIGAAAVGCAVALVGAAAGAAGSATSASVGPLTHAGIWTLDPQGRVVITHGFNIVQKTAPFYPPVFSAQDAQFLASEGFTGARIGFIWEGLEPKAGAYDHAYAARVASVNAVLAQYGFRTLVDFHQDSYGPKYGGDGAPAWASDDNLCVQSVCTATNQGTQAWANFWVNAPAPDGVGLRDHFTGAWKVAASALVGARNLLGLDLLNEPQPGSAYSYCPLFGPCPPFEQTVLPDFYRTLIGFIRAIHPHDILYYEPLAQFVNATTFLPQPLTADPQLGFTFHWYPRDCGAVPQPLTAIDATVQNLRCTPEETQDIAFGFNYATPAGAAIDAGEFGDTSNNTDLALNIDLMDQRFLNWTEWEYNTTIASLAPGLLIDDSKPGSEANARQDRLDAMVVPYPEAIAGTPTSYAFDRATTTMTLAYSTTPVNAAVACTSAPTLIFVPKRKYPHGYSVQVAGARVLSGPTSPWVELAALPGAASVSVSIRPASGSRTEMPTQAIDPTQSIAGCSGSTVASASGPPSQGGATAPGALANTTRAGSTMTAPAVAAALLSALVPWSRRRRRHQHAAN